MKKKEFFETYEMEHRRAERLSLNCKWLISQIDEIHLLLCPNENGTWQQRTEQVVKASERLSLRNTCNLHKEGHKKCAFVQTGVKCSCAPCRILPENER